MESYKKKFDEMMTTWDSKLESVRMLEFEKYWYIAYIDKLENATGIRKCYIALNLMVKLGEKMNVGILRKSSAKIIALIFSFYSLNKQ